VGRKVVWSEPAADDLVALVEFIAKDSQAFAATLAQRVCEAGDSLSELSERGRPFPDPMFPKFRELIIGPYRLVYAVEPERVVIHGVFHGKQDVISRLKKRR
jgi:toxin ParE1/3/4